MRPIWICGHRKCGTTLLTNLLDGHPDLFNYGSDFRLLYAIYNGFDQYGNEKEIKSRFLKVFSDDRTEKDILNSQYLAKTIGNLNFSSKDFIWHFLSAVLDKVKLDYPNKKLFIKETSSEIYIPSISQKYNPRFVYVVRDPRDNWAAISAGIEKYYEKLGENKLESLSSLVNRINLGFNAYKRNLNLLNNEILTIKFESLTKNTSGTMQQLSNYLNIDYKDILCEPTRNNASYSGNSHDDIEFSGVSKSNVGNFLDRVSRFEVAIIEALCEPTMSYFEYEMVTC